MFSIGNPRFAHDCSACLFLGRLGDHDTYYCPGSDRVSLGGSVVMRYGDGGPRYVSSPVSIALGITSDPLGDLARYVLREGLVRVTCVPERVAERRKLEAE